MLALRPRLSQLFGREEFKSLFQVIMAWDALISGRYNYIDKKSARALRSNIKIGLDGERVKLIISGNQIKKRASNALFLGYYIEEIKEKKSARASRSHVKVVLDGEEVKLIISGDQIKKRASNPLALRARILKLFWKEKKLK